MKTKDVLEFFGGPTATAAALGITQPAVSQWSENVPKSRAEHVRLAMDAELKRRKREEKRRERRVPKQSDGQKQGDAGQAKPAG